MEKLEIIIASNNEHKVNEYRKMFESFPHITLKSLNDEHIILDAEETGLSFKENAILKAQNVASKTNKIVLADDSGLEVSALNGFPGIYSSRFLNDKSQSYKNEAIIELLKDKSDRSAQFHCVIALANLTKDILTFEGIEKGYISDKPHGEHGFGYDPIFISSTYNKSFADLSEEEKNSSSHRGRAMKELISYLNSSNNLH